MSDEQNDRLRKLQEVTKMTASDDAVKLMCAGVCRERRLRNIGQLAQDDPAAFDELYDTIKDFVDQAPDDELGGAVW